jgi:hypothetical protein
MKNYAAKVFTILRTENINMIETAIYLTETDNKVNELNTSPGGGKVRQIL